jgi:uncharacterized coiled-coil protein SlyX
MCAEEIRQHGEIERLNGMLGDLGTEITRRDESITIWRDRAEAAERRAEELTERYQDNLRGQAKLVTRLIAAEASLATSDEENADLARANSESDDVIERLELRVSVRDDAIRDLSRSARYCRIKKLEASLAAANERVGRVDPSKALNEAAFLCRLVAQAKNDGATPMQAILETAERVHDELQVLARRSLDEGGE